MRMICRSLLFFEARPRQPGKEDGLIVPASHWPRPYQQICGHEKQPADADDRSAAAGRQGGHSQCDR